MKRNELIGKELRNAKSPGWHPGLWRELQNSDGSVNPASFGYQYTIQTTTLIRAEVIEQVFYEVPLADFFPVAVGEGAWLEDIKTNTTFQLAGGFASGIIATGIGPSQLGTVDVGTSPITAKLYKWAKEYGYTVPEVAQALASDNWDIVSGRMEALKEHWDLGIQDVGFLGLLQDLDNAPGLLSNGAVTVDLATIPGFISQMPADTFATLVASILGVYFANSNSTRLPTHFVLPMADFLGLGAPVSAQYPNVTKLAYLEDVFKRITKNPGFKIEGVAYADKANNVGYWDAAGTNRYALYRHDPKTVKMDIPVDFTLNPVGTANNWQFQGTGAGQFSGCIVYRPAEFIYFDN